MTTTTFNRRLFGAACISTFAAGALRRTIAQSVNEPDTDGPDFISLELPPDRLPEGTDPALLAERDRAAQILAAAPRTSPAEVFKYFESLLDRNKDGEAYNAGWRQRWNPVIVDFFKTTRTKPAGDTTFWCAASVNWMLKQCGFRTTKSALSGSFRGADGSLDTSTRQMVEDAYTEAPKPGDIVVFKSKDPGSAANGHGHVALFLEQKAGAIRVIGGNQRTPGGHHTICTLWFAKDGPVLVFDSYRSLDAFRVS
jgi:hypothetical protein